MTTARKQRPITWHGLWLGFIISLLAISAPAAALSSSACQTVINQALQTMQDKCSNISRNSVCYGNNQITTQFADNPVTPAFNRLGDVVSIKQIKTLLTSPLDLQNNTWGLALLKLQANLPDTMPGQNVTFLVFGDTAINNASGDMRVFYFSSGIGSPTCTELPAEGIVVQSPNHTQVSFAANGVQIQIASTIFLQANANQTLDVTLLEGHATVSTDLGSQTLQPGQMVSVPLGGMTGLEPQTSPHSPVNLDPKLVTVLKSLIQAPKVVKAPVVSVPGATPGKANLPGPLNGNGIRAMAVRAAAAVATATMAMVAMRPTSRARAQPPKLVQPTARWLVRHRHPRRAHRQLLQPVAKWPNVLIAHRRCAKSSPLR